MTSVVRPTETSASDYCRIARSVSVSSADVASSRIRIGGFSRNILAMAQTLLCPPESFTPRSPMDGVEPGRQPGDHFIQVGAVRRFETVRARAVLPVARRRCSPIDPAKRNILLHDADFAPQRRKRHAANIDAVNRDAACIDLIEARQQRAIAVFPAPDWPNEGDRFACIDGEIDMLQHPLVGPVTETDIVVANLAAKILTSIASCASTMSGSISSNSV